jgi:hypothetical protein
MSASRVHRPTEDEAVGNTKTPPRLSVQQILLDRAAARDRFDRLGEHLLGGLLARALDLRTGE